jgi:DNA-binding NtrC family response regulator
MTGNRGKAGRFYVQRAAYERKMIEDAIQWQRTHSGAARSLGLTRTYMLRLMRQLGMSRQHAQVGA